MYLKCTYFLSSFHAAIWISWLMLSLKSINNAESESNAKSILQSHCSVANCDDEAYSIDEFELISDHRAGKIISLTDRLNNCGSVIPRFDVQLKDRKNYRIICSHLISLVSVYWQPPLAPWTSRKKTHRKNSGILFLVMQNIPK